MQVVDPRRGIRQDAYDLRDQIHPDDHIHMQAHADATSANYTDDEEHSVLEDDSDGEERDDYIEDEDDGSSSLSVPNESIDFDLVYSLHSFAATVEGQANVVKGDSLYLMDDSNSYWWLVRVLKTQEVGYIPAENIETPFERLARLNKHRNVDLASATQAELQDHLHASQDRLRNNLNSRNGNTPSPSSRAIAATSQQTRGVNFRAVYRVFRYPPAVWNDEDDDDNDGWDVGSYDSHDEALAEEETQRGDGSGMSEPDDGMEWDDSAAESMQAQHEQEQRQLLAQQQQQIQQQQQQQQQQQKEALVQQQQQALAQQQAQQLRSQTSRERLQSQDAASGSPGPRRIDPAEATETRKLTVTPSIARETDTTPSINQGPQQLAPSVLLQQQQLDEERKRQREEEEESARKKAKALVANNTLISNSPTSVKTGAPARPTGNKLRKDPSRDSGGTTDDDSASSTKKKKSSVFGRLFGGREKSKDKNASVGSVDSSEYVRGSDDSGGRAGSSTSSHTRVLTANGVRDVNDVSPTTAQAIQQQSNARNPAPGAVPQQNLSTTPPQASHLTSGDRISSPQITQLRQRDQQQQALYQQYLNRSPASPPEAQPSYGLQSASAIMPSYTSPLASLNSASTSSSGLGLGLAGLGSSSSSNAANGNSLFVNSTLGPPAAPRARPGSLILTPSSIDGPGVGFGVPELSVIRVFAGKNLDTEATFKTVLLNSSTTGEDLIRQAIQRFRLPVTDPIAQPQQQEGGMGVPIGGFSDYYLTVKQVEGGASTVIRPNEKPLVVFEGLIEAAMEMPKVKRSSVGSISSVASNLSMHPAIKKLPMNDFTDDSALKFYLNKRRTTVGSTSGATSASSAGVAGSRGWEGDDSDEDEEETFSADSSYEPTVIGSPITNSPRRDYLTVGNAPSDSNEGGNIQDRFISPSFKFATQVVIHHGDLPEDMCFHPTTEAIIFKESLDGDNNYIGQTPNSPSVNVTFAGGSGSGASHTLRKKVFVFPRNITVAEVIELGLERFGILEGVVDGGDEIEDKMTNRRSRMRVRYVLKVDVGDGQERELAPKSRIIDAFPRPPTTFKVSANANKRRSVDSANLLGSVEDIHPEDPVFVLRRATSYRVSTSRHRISAALDDVALRQRHRESMSSFSDPALTPSASGALATSKTSPPPISQLSDESKRRQAILEQRNAIRANQKAILSAQTNSARGTDVLLPDNAMLRSSRYDDNSDRMRYSYVQPDGETYDISDIVEEEWRDNTGVGIAGNGFGVGAVGGDLLEGFVKGTVKDGEKLERVLQRVQSGRRPNGRSGGGATPIQQLQQQKSSHPHSQVLSQSQLHGQTSLRSVSPASQYSIDDSSITDAYGGRSRSATPGSAGLTSMMPGSQDNRPGTTTPTASKVRHPSIASVMSDVSDYGAAQRTTQNDSTSHVPGHAHSRPDSSQASSQWQQKAPQARAQKGPLVIPNDDFGIEQMMAVIDLKSTKYSHSPFGAGGTELGLPSLRVKMPPLEPVDELLFGRPVELESLHPVIQDIYAETFKHFVDMDKVLDDFLLDIRG